MCYHSPNALPLSPLHANTFLLPQAFLVSPRPFSKSRTGGRPPQSAMKSGDREEAFCYYFYIVSSPSVITCSPIHARDLRTSSATRKLRSVDLRLTVVRLSLNGVSLQVTPTRTFIRFRGPWVRFYTATWIARSLSNENRTMDFFFTTVSSKRAHRRSNRTGLLCIGFKFRWLLCGFSLSPFQTPLTLTHRHPPSSPHDTHAPPTPHHPPLTDVRPPPRPTPRTTPVPHRCTPPDAHLPPRPPRPAEYQFP